MITSKKYSSKKISRKPMYVAIISSIVLLAICYPLFKKLTQHREVGREIDGLRREISDLESKGTELKDMIAYLQSDFYVEEQARENLNYKKDGEEVAVIKGMDNSVITDGTPAGISIASFPAESDFGRPFLPVENAQKWWAYFFKQ